MPVNIKGKTYYTVNDRIKLLNKDFGHSRYTLSTEITHMTESEVVIKATLTLIFPGKDPNTGASLLHKTSFTGLAHEVRGAGFINETSHVENAETSAIGRSLAAAGYGGDEYASANEVENAIYQRNVNGEKPKPRPLKKADAESLEVLKSYLGHESFDEEQNTWLSEFLNQRFDSSHSKDINSMHQKVLAHVKTMEVKPPSKPQKTKKSKKKEVVHG
jgi:hypothetical protein